MQEATDQTTTPPEASPEALRKALFGMESPLMDLEPVANLLRHSATTDYTLESVDLLFLAGALDALRRDLIGKWEAALVQFRGIDAAHKVALAQARAEVLPGSEAEQKKVEALRWLMVAAARTVLKEATTERAASKRDRKPRKRRQASNGHVIAKAVA